jgi:hypothetical protein
MGGSTCRRDDESVEIARLSIASTTGDVTSVRARKDGNLIRLQIVDEYETEYSFEPTTSDRPLSLGELIDLIDSATHEDAVSTGLVKDIAMLWLNGVVDNADIRDGIKMTSAFYPQLQAYYERRLDSWIAEKRDT